MRFKDAVAATAELSSAYRQGLQALREVDRNRIPCRNTRRLAGSVNIEAHVRSRRPNDPSWDYGISWQLNDESAHAIWVEVHPASSTHVDDVINKARWLRGWLKDSAPKLLGITRREDAYVWLASGGVSFQRNFPQARKLAQAGVSFPRERFSLA